MNGVLHPIKFAKQLVELAFRALLSEFANHLKMERVTRLKNSTCSYGSRGTPIYPK